MTHSEELSMYTLRMYIQYHKLTVHSLGHLTSALASLSDVAVEHYASTTNQSHTQLPTLEIETVHTGHSIKFTFGEGWLPSVSSNSEHDILIDVPKKMGIPLVIGYLLLGAAQQGLNVRNEYLDSRIKEIELKLKDNELQEAISKSKGAKELLQGKALSLILSLRENSDYKVFLIEGADITGIQKCHGPSHKGKES